MNPSISRFCPPAAALSAAFFATGELPAQLPVGHLVQSNYSWPANYSGLGGIFFVDPTTSTATKLSNLPCELAGTCPDPGTPWSGPDHVIHLPRTGQLLTNGPNHLNQSVDAFLLTVSGTTVVLSQRYPLATYTTGSGLANPAATNLPDGRVLLAIDPTSMGAPGPLAGALLGILDPTLAPNSPGAVTPVPVAPIPAGVTNGLAYDADRGIAYVVMIGGSTQEIWSVPVPGGGTPTFVASVLGSVNCLAIEPDGKILVGGFYSVVARVWRVDPTTGSTQVLWQTASTGERVNALHVDPVTGDLFLVMPDNSIGRLSPRTTTGQLTTVVSQPAAGWGRPSGLDMNASLTNYGTTSGSPAIAEWQLGPNPGGAPTVGNATFTLTNTTTPASPVSLWAIGLTDDAVTLPTTPSIDLLVAPLTSVLTLNGNPAQPSTLSFPIPSDPGLAGLPIYFQCAHLSGAAISASRGLRVTIE